MLPRSVIATFEVNGVVESLQTSWSSVCWALAPRTESSALASMIVTKQSNRKHSSWIGTFNVICYLIQPSTGSIIVQSCVVVSFLCVRLSLFLVWHFDRALDTFLLQGCYRVPIFSSLAELVQKDYDHKYCIKGKLRCL